MQALPIDSLLPDVRAALNHSPYLVLEAAPGAGKTTRVPAYLLDSLPGEILVLEPRRLAARLAARRVASERNERVGQTIGYQVRFEDNSSASTRLRYLTEGVLNRRLAQDPLLPRISAVVLDEFHERHLEGDLALALLLHLQRTRRPDLKLILMSATLDAAPIAAHLGNCPILRSEGRLYPLETRYTPESAQTLDQRVSSALAAVLKEKPQGDVLIFLPGAGEIRRAMQSCQDLTRRYDLLLAPLYGDLSPEEQDIAVSPSRQRKVIFSTNIAESSVTIDGVSIVIDSGLARMSADSKTTGLPVLGLGKVSRASCIQRAGRAARTSPGLCLRLYTERDFLSRPERGIPEISERELSGLLLQLRAMGINDPTSLPWLTPPAAADVARAMALLDELGASGATAQRMADMPLHPRLSRMLLEAEQRGVGTEATRVAALLSSGERLPTSDLVHNAERQLSPYAQKVARQLERQLRSSRRASDWEKPLAECLLAAYPDRVAKRRKDDEYELSGGISAKLSNPPPKPPEWLIAIDVDEMVERSTTLIRVACPIEADWLLELFPNSIEEVDRFNWSRQSERCEQESAMLFHGLVLDRTVNPRPQSKGAAEFLASKLRDAGWRRFLDVEETELLLARAAFAKEHGWPVKLDEEALLHLLGRLCEGRNGFDQVREAVSNGEWQYRLDEYLGTHKSLLEQLAPQRIQLPAGRSVRVQYVPNQPPWIASRLQDFIGMNETPRIANGKVALLVHLLAPNQRPVQMTQDLKSFWEKLYPELRGQLSRRYPRHIWP
jgi:ATP-dependent helicase HrpB